MATGRRVTRRVGAVGRRGEAKKAAVSASPVLQLLLLRRTRIQRQGKQTGREEHRLLLSLMQVLESKLMTAKKGIRIVQVMPPEGADAASGMSQLAPGSGAEQVLAMHERRGAPALKRRFVKGLSFLGPAVVCT